MRIARVLHAQNPTPIVALERNGVLYDVAELDRHLGTRYSPDRLAGSSDFHTRVVALSCAGLFELDEALRAGRHPRDARLLPGSYLWLAPCVTDRALYVHADSAAVGGQSAEPFYTLGHARAFAANPPGRRSRARQGHEAAGGRACRHRACAQTPGSRGGASRHAEAHHARARAPARTHRGARDAAGPRDRRRETPAVHGQGLSPARGPNATRPAATPEL